MLMIAKMQRMVMRIMMVLVREHNRVAAELAQLHPMWDDEKLYMEVIVMIIIIVGAVHILRNTFWGSQQTLVSYPTI